MINKFSALLASAAIATGTIATLAAAPAHAATFACESSISGLVSGTSACERSNSATQDFLNTNPMTVNSEEFFDSTNWVFGGKIGENTGYLGTGEGKTGTWNISSVVENTWENIMLVFKSGQGTTLVGYQLEDGVTSGTWSSPFLKSVFGFNGGNVKDVSHISVYYTVGDPKPPVTQVPEPATILALGLVAGGMAVSRRRKFC
ncbi:MULTISPECIES: PEP-CTERM sorting domain-containing protein [unclassified Anabaena]|uniref:PEP-CTERM sorting domain-containing protein n=1 Tax=unclassified Anabaena TaxID=2619674 RepID=UPI0039C6D08E